MVIGRFRDVVSDVAETIRRAFKDPFCRDIPLGLPEPGAGAVTMLETSGRELSYRFNPVISIPDLNFSPAIQEGPMRFEPVQRSENAWTTWASGAKVSDMSMFKVGNCTRLAVPALPRSAVIRKSELPPFKTASRGIREAFAPPRARGLAPGIAAPKTRSGLASILGLPIAIAGLDFQKLPKALNMRYTFQLVKATGENIRNLDVLGVFPVPLKGVAELQHDPKTGRILVNLNQDSVGARRGRFILARKKDDRGYVSCFVEE
jgi:hypothetical protein